MNAKHMTITTLLKHATNSQLTINTNKQQANKRKQTTKYKTNNK